MTAAAASWVEVQAAYEHLANCAAALGAAIRSGDMLTARYAAASITEHSDSIETALLSIDHGARGLAPVRLIPSGGNCDTD